jgi:hypothetical protein
VRYNENYFVNTNRPDWLDEIKEQTNQNLSVLSKIRTAHNQHDRINHVDQQLSTLPPTQFKARFYTAKTDDLLPHQ